MRLEDWIDEEIAREQEAARARYERRRHDLEVAVQLVKVFAGLLFVMGLLIAARAIVRKMDASFYDRLEAESPTAAKVAREAVQNDAFASWCENVLKKVIY